VYLSHPVRRIRESPAAAATVRLVVELGDATPAELERAVAAAGGTVREELGFDAWLVELPETGVDRLCRLDGVVGVETDATVSLGDAGEDV